jgi:pimeloyl-ACP methyl ester carboxylesterase
VTRVIESTKAGFAVTEYRPAGDWDRTVVLLSSLGVSRRSWAAVGPVLGERHRCLAVDLPGHGDSRPAAHFMTISGFADALAAMLDAEGVRNAVVVGNSMGATVGTALADTRPDLVSELVHVGSAVWDSEQARRDWLQSRSGLFCRPDGTLQEMTEDFVVAIFGEYDADRHRMLREDQERSGSRLGWAMWALYSYDSAAALRRLGQPVLAVFGERDPYREVSLPSLRRYVARLDEVIVPGGSHLLPVDQGPRLAAHIETWLGATPTTIEAHVRAKETA